MLASARVARQRGLLALEGLRGALYERPEGGWGRAVAKPARFHTSEELDGLGLLHCNYSFLTQ
jgi:hypothetical protein